MTDSLQVAAAQPQAGSADLAVSGILEPPVLRRPKILIVAFYFPPAGGGGVQRPLKFAEHLHTRGFEVHVLAPDDPKWIDRDESQPLPEHVRVHRARFLGPRGRRPAEELHALEGMPLRRTLHRGRLLGRRVLVPDENVSWGATAIAAASGIVRREGIDVVLTTSPPGSVHLVGAAVKRMTGVPWVADLRDPLVAHPHRRVESRLVRAKEAGLRAVESLVAGHADAVIAVSDAISDELRNRGRRGPVVTIPNGADFDDFEGLPYRRGGQFRITHTGSFFGRRDPRPFLQALERVDGVVASFIGDSRAADREWAESLELVGPAGVGSLHGQSPHSRTAARLRSAPPADPRGRWARSRCAVRKGVEYLASGRPILALVPPDGVAAGLLRELGAGPVVAPDDVDGAARALEELRDRWRLGDDLDVRLGPEARHRVSRTARVDELAGLLLDLVGKQRSFPAGRPISLDREDRRSLVG